jgi:formylglycine-generating enzyme required for sulfatase activity
LIERTTISRWINQAYVKEEWNWYWTMGPYRVANVDPYVLTTEAERGLKPLESFRECTKDCPEMIVVPAGEFTMGSPATEKGRNGNEGPQDTVTIARPFAVSKFEVTFEQWDACVTVGGCLQASDSGYGRGTNPVNNVNWDAAQQYVAWLRKMTDRHYRLLSEAEWEYAARARTDAAYSWGDEIGKGNANCDGCGSQWDRRQPAPVGSFTANKFGLYDMQGNVWEWVEDCRHDDYGGDPPSDGSAWTTRCPNIGNRVVHGGSWNVIPQSLRSAVRIRGSAGGRNYGDGGFRVGRTLSPCTCDDYGIVEVAAVVIVAVAVLVSVGADQGTDTAGDRFSRARISLPALKYGQAFFSTATARPVRGFRAVRARRLLTENMPKPRISTRSPRASA